MIVKADEEVKHLYWPTDPRIEGPATFTEIHGVTMEYAGRSAGEIAFEVAEQIAYAWETGWPVVVFNAPYDLTVLHHELIRHGDSRGLEALPVIAPVVDPFVLDKYVDRYRAGSRTLADTCEHYGLSLFKAHNTRADAFAAVRLAWGIVSCYPHIHTVTLAELHSTQRNVYRESQQSFAKYLRKTVAPKLCAEAALLGTDKRAAKLAELSEVLADADSVDAHADGWPFQPGR